MARRTPPNRCAVALLKFHTRYFCRSPSTDDSGCAGEARRRTAARRGRPAVYDARRRDDFIYLESALIEYGHFTSRAAAAVIRLFQFTVKPIGRVYAMRPPIHALRRGGRGRGRLVFRAAHRHARSPDLYARSMNHRNRRKRFRT